MCLAFAARRIGVDVGSSDGDRSVYALKYDIEAGKTGDTEVICFDTRTSGKRLAFRCPSDGRIKYSYAGHGMYDDTKLEDVGGINVKVVGMSSIYYYEVKKTDCDALYKEYDVETVDSLTSEYVPVVGDVVEFEYAHLGTHIGVKGPGHTYAPYAGATLGATLGAFSLGMMDNCRFTGRHIDGVTADNVEEIAKGLRPVDKEPVFVGTYAERQKQWIKHHGIKKGSEVVVTRFNEDNEDGSFACSHSQERVDSRAGGVARVVDINSRYIEIRHGDLGSWSMPYTVLEPVHEI